jgi:hypothetical protein
MKSSQNLGPMLKADGKASSSLHFPNVKNIEDGRLPSSTRTGLELWGEFFDIDTKGSCIGRLQSVLDI